MYESYFCFYEGSVLSLCGKAVEYLGVEDRSAPLYEGTKNGIMEEGRKLKILIFFLKSFEFMFTIFSVLTLFDFDYSCCLLILYELMKTNNQIA